MAAIFVQNDLTNFPILSLEELRVLVSESNIPEFTGKIVGYYKSFQIPRGRLTSASKIAWNDARFSRSGRNKIVIIVDNIDSKNGHIISIKQFDMAEETRLLGLRSSPTCFVLDKIVLDNFDPKTSNGVFAILGQVGDDATPAYSLLLIRQDLSVPNGGGGAPYAGAKIPNG